MTSSPQSSPRAVLLPAFIVATLLGVASFATACSDANGWSQKPRSTSSKPDTSKTRAAADSSGTADASEATQQLSEVVLRAGSKIVLTPESELLATLSREVDVSVLRRSGEWLKVRMEAWVRASDVAAESEKSPTVTGAMVRADPDKYVGQTVVWRLQHLSVQVSDALRPEIREGRHYLLARGPLPSVGFVYVMLTKAQADEIKKLAPLDEVVVEAVIRHGRTRFLPIPVLELTKQVSP